MKYLTEQFLMTIGFYLSLIGYFRVGALLVFLVTFLVHKKGENDGV